MKYLYFTLHPSLFTLLTTVGKKSSNSKKTVKTLTHDEASRKNIPTAEYQSVMAKEQQTPIRMA